MAFPLVGSALSRSVAWTLGTTLVATLAGGVRVLPWLLDRHVPWRVALPFGRSLMALAVEAAVLVGWPVGAAMACHAFAARGEARVLGLLGERPSRTVTRLLPQWVVFAALLGAASALAGVDATAPGVVATALLGQGRVACERASVPASYAVPLVGATWLCGPSQSPRLFGLGPGSMAAVAFSASHARVSGDLKRLDLDDARLLLGSPDAPRAVHVRALAIRGLSPWAAGSNLRPWARALILAISGLISAFVASWACLRGASRWPVAALAIGAAGPIAALATLRALERTSSNSAVFVLAPLAACTAALLAAAIGSRSRAAPSGASH